MNKNLARAVAMAMTGTALSLGGASDASAAATTMYNMYRGNFAGYDANGLGIYAAASTTPCSPCANSTSAPVGIANDAGGWTDGWVWSANPQLGQVDPLPNPKSPVTPIGETAANAAANRPGWVGIGGSSTPSNTTPFGYAGSTTLHWAVQFTGSGANSAEISNADSRTRYNQSADVDTARGAWSDAVLTGASGWRHDLDFGLFKSDVTGPVTLSAVGVSGDGTTKAFGFTIFKGMDTSTGAYNHHGAWNSGNNTGGVTSASLPGGGFNLKTTDIVAFSVGGATPQNLNTITFDATAGQVYTIVLGGYKNGGWTDTTDGYKLTFSQASSKYTLNVSTTATGTGISGTVTSNTGGISCSSSSTAGCSADFDPNTAVILTATPGNGDSKLDKWGGDCTSAGSAATCNVTMSQARTVTAAFVAATKYALTVTPPSNGTIMTTGTSTGINCGTGGSDCTEQLNEGTTVTLTATPQSGYSFGAWTGCTSSSGNTCSVTMSGAKTIAATFNEQKNSLSVTTKGTGTVTSNPAGINCPGDCGEDYSFNTTVTLTATPGSGYEFSSWSGCTPAVPANTCTVSMSTAKTVTTNFTTIPKYTLNVSKPGDGSGTVTSSPGGINCGGDCTEDYLRDTSVTLTAVATGGSEFTGWGGACSGTNLCTVTMTALTSVTANFKELPPAKFLMTVTPPANGKITSKPAGIDCGTTSCSFSFDNGASVTLTADPDPDFQFSSWGGACTGTTDTSCTVSMTAALSVSASFAVIPPPDKFALTVSKDGNGKVTSTPAGIDCGTTCSVAYTDGDTVILAANPDVGYSFTGWTGDCTNTSGDCTVSMTQARNVKATFTLIPPTQYALTVSPPTNGTVTSSPAGIDCGADCSESFDEGTDVTLTAKPAAGYQFSGWTGDCAGADPCKVKMTGLKNVSAGFAALPPSKFTLSVTNGGHGTVTSTPAGIDCGIECTFEFAGGASVTLAAKADAGFEFTGWTGDCTNTSGDCTVTMSQARNVTATFNASAVSYLLTVNASNGRVTSKPEGIDCGTDCTENFAAGTVVTLTAKENSGFEFTGWSGGVCSGTGTCIVTMDSAKDVTAEFTASPVDLFQLDVTKNGDGSGKVTSSPTGIDCGSDCTEDFPATTVVTLTAAADANSKFTGWTGAGCSGTSTCEVTMGAARSVTATFDLLPPNQFALTVTNGGNGKVTSTPAGIDCGTTCTASFNSGDPVTLKAVPASGYQFSGWSGACTNTTGDCDVQMDAAKDVTATFTLIPLPTQRTLTVTNGGHGKVTSNPAGIDCGSDCDQAFDDGTKVTLTATPDSGYQFSGWSGACTNTSGPCPVDMKDADKKVTATFTVIPPPSEHTLTVTNLGHGTVTSRPTGISCGATCADSFPADARVTLVPTPDRGYRFSGWSGDCTGLSCSLAMNGAKKVTATFALIPPPNNYTLTVTNGGHGKVTSSPAGIDCGATCTSAFVDGQRIVLTAAPDDGYQFSGWSGACTNASGDCSVRMTDHQNVSATFTLIPPPNEFTLTISNGGHGSVSSDPAGIDCGATCSAVFPGGQSVTLTAKADDGWRFSGWSGACTGTDACTVAMSEARNVAASFVLPPQRDFNGDGYADLFWRQNATGKGDLWLMDDGEIISNKGVPQKGKSWLLVSTADFNGDDKRDILWRHRATGQNHIWLMNGAKVKSEVVLPDQVPAFDETGTGDFDGDRHTDIVWYNPSNGETRLWLMDGATFKSAVPLPTAPPGASLAAVADFNGDGSPDIWWYTRATGQSVLWLMAGTSVLSTEIPPAQSSDWIFAGTGLFDGDTAADVLWRNRATNANQLWVMNGATRTASVDLPNMPKPWFVAGIDDFAGNGSADVLWRSRKDGRNRLWLMDGTSLQGKQPIKANEVGWSTPSQ